jgi:hypothetical protein
MKIDPVKIPLKITVRDAPIFIHQSALTIQRVLASA